jgi:hypothetical protein
MRKCTVKILTIAYSSLKSTKMLRNVSVELGSSSRIPMGLSMIPLGCVVRICKVFLAGQRDLMWVVKISHEIVYTWDCVWDVMRKYIVKNSSVPHNSSKSTKMLRIVSVELGSSSCIPMGLSMIPLGCVVRICKVFLAGQWDLMWVVKISHEIVYTGDCV